ncbi:hypothetical protein EV650_1508 [Kribbella kalugense]|uniref:Uncharacterized protein n=2 Tax=Kribbella kalugense TaxID=2512221 RepID=A0A4R8A3A1_9ACTN|nr:hypothetical protein EV650_1508 [Kribbella kalugense]
MFIKAEGPQLTPDQARDLDDAYFTSRPLEYYSARIASLIAVAESGERNRSGDVGAAFLAALEIDDEAKILDFDGSDRRLQVATDSLAVRQHAAEALVRLYHSVAIGRVPGDTAACMWVAISDGPVAVRELANQAAERLASDDGRQTFWTLVLPSEAGEKPAPENDVALNVMGAWLQYAILLLQRDDVSVNVAGNKIKHGLAVRSRDDVRLVFTKQPPSSDGTMPLSAVSGPGAIDIFSSETLSYLVRPSRQNGRKQPLELTTLSLVPAMLLAETWMLAATHAAMFYIAATQHFAGRKASLPKYPSLPLGPTPQQLLGDSVIGMRFPVTTPPNGGPVDRFAGLASQLGFASLEIDFENKTSVELVNDTHTIESEKHTASPDEGKLSVSDDVPIAEPTKHSES